MIWRSWYRKIIWNVKVFTELSKFIFKYQDIQSKIAIFAKYWYSIFKKKAPNFFVRSFFIKNRNRKFWSTFALERLTILNFDWVELFYSKFKSRIFRFDEYFLIWKLIEISGDVEILKEKFCWFLVLYILQKKSKIETTSKAKYSAKMGRVRTMVL